MSHLEVAFLIRAIDDELSGTERAVLEEHLAGCEECRLRHRELGALTIRLEQAIGRTPVAVGFEERSALRCALANTKKQQRWPAVMKWSAAAAILIGAILVPGLKRYGHVPAGTAPALEPATFEVDGETFIALPYSNPELPLNTARIVQMQVPVSSLADAGVVVAPLTPDAADRAVLADVLLGEDGEPRAVHIVSE